MAEAPPNPRAPAEPAGNPSERPQVSIIVPVYNCARFLDQCLQSLLAQSFSGFEVLLIDDGSSDGSGDICDRYAAQDARLRVVHKPNGGVSSARNLALDLARGVYTLFVDADDYVVPAFVQRLKEQMETHDVVVCAYDRVREGSEQPFVLGRTAELPLDSLYEHTLCTQMIGGGCCNKVFRLETINRHALRFDTRIAVGEDMLFLVQYFQHCTSAYYVGDVLYHYRFNEVSSNESGFVQREVSASSISILMAMDEMEQYVDRSVHYQAQALDYRKARSSLRLFFQMVLAQKSDRAALRSIRQNIRQSIGGFVRSRHSKALERVVACGIAVSARLTYVFAAACAPVLKGRLDAYRT